MSAIPGLKKKLKSVRATGKLSKAMKTVSAAKFSRLSAAWKNYELYAGQFRFLYENEADTLPDVVVVLGSNRGFCGGFNSDVLRFFRENVPECNNLIVCGEEMQQVFSEAGFSFETYSFGDVPKFADCEPLLARLSAMSDGQPLHALLVYPEFINTMTQTPTAVRLTLNPDSAEGDLEDYLCLPERKTVMQALYEKGSRSVLYGAVLSTALGAQASTLMTMRSAYDTATEYSQALEGEIHRLRQSEVTSDVIETSSERGAKGETANG